MISCERGGWSGGAEQFFLLAEGMRRRGHSVNVSCVKGSPLERKLNDSGFNVLSLPMWNDVDIYSSLKLAQYSARNNFEIIHAMHSRGHSVALLASYFLKDIPLIITRRVSFPLKNNIYVRFKYKDRKISKFICVSGAVKRELVKLGVPDDKIEVVYSGVDTNRFYPRDKNLALIKELGINADTPLIGSVANFSKWKGQRVFLEAAKIIKEKKLKFHFLIAGTGNNAEPVNTWIKTLGLEGFVSQMGFVYDVPSVMSALDVFVSPSVGAEGLSGTLREALAMALPVVATDVGGNSEIVKDMETGILVPPGDPESIADGIEFLVKNREKAMAMADKGRRFVIENCSVEKMVERTEEVYRQVL